MEEITSQAGGGEGGISKYLSTNPELTVQIQRIKSNPLNHTPPPIPSLPLLSPVMSTSRKVRSIQRYISALEYNYTGQTFVRKRPGRGMNHLVVTAKTIIRASLPIQCVEALFVAVHLTNKIEELLRLPVRFKSLADGIEHAHIVLAVRGKNKWGAMGISRLSGLMDKQLQFNNLADLIEEFLNSYKKYHHQVIEFELGLPFSHDHVSETPLHWKVIKFVLKGKEKCWNNYRDTLIQYSRDCTIIFQHVERTQSLPEWFDYKYRNGFVGIRSSRR